MCKIAKLIFSLTAATAVILGSGCKTAAPKPSGFLSDYSRLRQANDSTWTYVDANRLSPYKKFVVAPAKVMVKQYWGTAFSTDQRDKIAALFRQKVVKDLAAGFEIVAAPGADTAEVRVAITQAYRVGDALALGVEAEIVDSQSHQQLAAIQGVRIGPPEMGFRVGPHNPADPSNFIPAWWDWPSASELMNRWAAKVREIVEDARKR
jgi:hypothetical protein